MDFPSTLQLKYHLCPFTRFSRNPRALPMQEAACSPYLWFCFCFIRLFFRFYIKENSYGFCLWHIWLRISSRSIYAITNRISFFLWLIFHCICESEVAQSCPTLCEPVDCSLPGFSVHGIRQAKTLKWVIISFSRRSSRPRDRTQVSRIGGRCFNLWATREAPLYGSSIHDRWQAASRW